MSHHDILFVYVGATSQLKVNTLDPKPEPDHTPDLYPLVCFQGNYTSAAEELIVHTYFFSAARDVLPKVQHAQDRAVE